MYLVVVETNLSGTELIFEAVYVVDYYTNSVYIGFGTSNIYKTFMHVCILQMNRI